MPSPTSITVPTSLTCTRCSKPAISCFRMLVISATLMAISEMLRYSALRNEIPWYAAGTCRYDWLPKTIAPNLLLPPRRQQPFAHRLELIPHARVDQPVLHPQHQ